jgi:hypothetical protein
MRRTIVFAVILLTLLGLSIGCHKAVDDTTLANDIKAKMFSDPDLKASSVDVAVKDGVVTLSGSVSQASVKQKAEQLAGSIPGVKSVNDQVDAPGSPAGTTTTAAGAPASAPPPSSALPPSTPAEQPVTAQIPAGKTVSIRTNSTIDSSVNRTGQTFAASLSEPIVVHNEVIVPKGTEVTLLLAEDKRAGHLKGRSEVELRLDHLTYQGQTYPLDSTVIEERGKSRGKDTGEKAAIGAGVGAVIGALAGHGKGAAIGAAAGGGAGVGYQLMTHGQSVKVPAESRLDFRLVEPVTVTYLKSKLSERSDAR